MARMTTFIVKLCISLMLLFPIAANANETVFDKVMETQTLNVGYFVWAPYLVKDANTGKMSGINYDIMEAIGQNLGLKINWVLDVGVGEVGAALESHKIDAMGVTIWPSPARYQAMKFSIRPQFYSTIYAVARNDDKRFESNLNEANTKEIITAGIEGDYSSELAHELLPHAKHVALPASASAGEYILQVVTKKADILFIDKGGINEFNKTNPGKIRILEKIGPVRVYGEHMVVKRGEYQLRDMLDVALLQLINDGTVDKLVEKYKSKYNVDIYSSQSDVKIK